MIRDHKKGNTMFKAISHQITMVALTTFLFLIPKNAHASTLPSGLGMLKSAFLKVLGFLRPTTFEGLVGPPWTGYVLVALALSAGFYTAWKIPKGEEKDMLGLFGGLMLAIIAVTVIIGTPIALVRGGWGSLTGDRDTGMKGLKMAVVGVLAVVIGWKIKGTLLKIVEWIGKLAGGSWKGIMDSAGNGSNTALRVLGGFFFTGILNSHWLSTEKYSWISSWLCLAGPVLVHIPDLWRLAFGDKDPRCHVGIQKQRGSELLTDRHGNPSLRKCGKKIVDGVCEGCGTPETYVHSCGQKVSTRKAKCHHCKERLVLNSSGDTGSGPTSPPTLTLVDDTNSAHPSQQGQPSTTAATTGTTKQAKKEAPGLGKMPCPTCTALKTPGAPCKLCDKVAGNYFR